MSVKRKEFKGLPISAGIAMGITRVILPDSVRVAEVRIPASRVSQESKALENAVDATLIELQNLKESAGKKIGLPIAKVFDAQLLMAQDQEFLNRVKSEISKQKRNAGFIYNKLVQEITLPLKNSNDPYIQQMAQDVYAVSERVISHLSGYRAKSTERFPKDTILVSKSFTPGEILSYRNRKAIGFVTGEGGISSHMALIARSLMLPLVVIDRSWQKIADNSRFIIDGSVGIVIVNPDNDEWNDYLVRKKKQGPGTVTRIKKLHSLPPKTSNGKPITVMANLEIPGPVDEILTSQNIAIGLYRTEFLYLENEDFPSEERQFEHYKQIAETYGDNFVAIRTFDLGSDKIKQDGLIPPEDNPALGFRGVRVMLEYLNLFKDQIRAILRASAFGKIKIMVPMITDISEYTKVKKIIKQEMLKLKRAKIEYDKNIEIGIMIEVPSAALIADKFAEKVDFIAIGSNDLSQYTLAVDRNNAHVAYLYNSLHPSVLQLIQNTVTAARKHNIPVSICGEIAGDLLALPLFIGMGIRNLSMNPTRIFDVCRQITKIDSELAKLLVEAVKSCSTTAEVIKVLKRFRDTQK